MLNVVIRLLSKSRSLFESTDQQRSESLFGLALFTPALVLLVSLFLVPIAYIFYLSFQEVGIFGSEGVFVGVRNYVDLATNSEFLYAIWIGLYYAVGSVAFQLIVGLSLALLANQTFFGSSVVRTLVIFPYLVPMIAVVIMWQWLVSPAYGMINHFLVAFGVTAGSIDFFGHPDLVMPSLIVATSWKYTAFVSLILLARLQAIDDALYEQARICGASAWQRFREITLPNLWSAILLVVFLRLVFMFNKYGAIWMFTEGGPLNRSTNLPIYIYQVTFQQFELGTGSAAAMIFFFILVFFAFVYFWRFNPSEEIEAR